MGLSKDDWVLDFAFFSWQVTPESQSDFGSYNCTATNVIGTESKEFILIQAGLWMSRLQFKSMAKWKLGFPLLAY